MKPPAESSSVRPRDSGALNAMIALVLLGVGLLLRLPYFFPAVIDWDESTQILMGQSILDGHLPYVDLWDNKPPLSFLAYALIISLFGESIVGVRVAGLLLVTGTSFLVYLIGNKIWGREAGVLGALLSTTFISSTPGGQATMTEIVALLPLVCALAILVVKGCGTRALFIAGFLLSVAALVRLNLAYVALFAGLGVAVDRRRCSGSEIRAALLAYAAGGFAPLLLAAAPYLYLGLGELLLASAIQAPLSYSAAQHSVLDALEIQFANGLRSNAPLWFGFLLGSVWTVRVWNQQERDRKRGVALIGVFLLGTAISILASGAAHPHYLLQLVPFLALVTGAFGARFLFSPARLVAVGVLVLMFASTLRPVVPEYASMLKRMRSGQSLAHGPAFRLAEFLAERNPNGEPMYLLTDHIVYWFTKTRPLTKATTHPSNVAKDYLLEAIAGAGASAETEMARVLGLKPAFVVKLERQWYLDGAPGARSMLNDELSSSYREVGRFAGRRVFQRRPAQDDP